MTVIPLYVTAVLANVTVQRKSDRFSRGNKAVAFLARCLLSYAELNGTPSVCASRPEETHYTRSELLARSIPRYHDSLEMITNLIIEANNHCPSPRTNWRTSHLRWSEEIPAALEEILSILDSAGYSAKEKFAIRLSLEEALLNAIKHGHKGDPTKQVQLRYHLSPEYLLAEIEDQGP